MKITKPNSDEFAPYYQRYIDNIKTEDPIDGLVKSRKEVEKLISKLSKKELNFRYAEGKWSIKEILVHIMDGERVFNYRALSFARNDKNELPGFEENEWAPESKADSRKIKSILKEYKAIRKATIEMYSNFNDEMLMRMGRASNNPVSVRALLYITLGHEMHHLKVIREKYLTKS
jgi:uncharacterized damage-inducible protein DinB